MLAKVLNGLTAYNVDTGAPAVVVLSGGQDSMTCAALARAFHPAAFAIGFNYGQRHVVELEGAQRFCDMHGVPFRVIDLSFFGHLVTSALTGNGSVNTSHPRMPGLPASFVPNRNALFLTIAHAYAQEVGAQTVYTGVCQTDYSGYPDCRAVFIGTLEDALNTGYEQNIRLATPLMWASKAHTFRLAEQLGVLQYILEYSHTCYNGDHTTRHEWGFGCGECPACQLRANGWNDFRNTAEA